MYELKKQFIIPAEERDMVLQNKVGKGFIIDKLIKQITLLTKKSDTPVHYLLSRSGNKTVNRHKETVAKWICELNPVLSDSDMAKLCFDNLLAHTAYRTLISLVYQKSTPIYADQHSSKFANA